MAINRIGTDVSVSGNTVPGTDSSLVHTSVAGTAGNRKIVVYIMGENGDTIDVSGVTYGGQAMTEAVGGVSTTTGFRQYGSIWYLDEAGIAAAGDDANTVAVTFTGTASTPEYSIYCAQYEDVAQGAPSATDIDAQTAGATITNTVPSTNATQWVFSCGSAGNTGSWAHGQSQVELYDFTDASSQHFVAEKRGGAGDTSIDSTCTGTINRLQRMCAVWDEHVGPTITSVTPDDPLRMDQSSVTVAGTLFEATQGSGRVEISDNATTGSGTIVDVSAAVTSWSDTSISLNLDSLPQATLDALHSLRPGDGNRYVHVINDSAQESGGFAVHLMRPIALTLSNSTYCGKRREHYRAADGPGERNVRWWSDSGR